MANKKKCTAMQRRTSKHSDMAAAVPYDATYCDAYREAMEDVKAGRVYKASNVDDMFKQVLS